MKSHSSELPPSAYHTQTSSYNVQLIFLYDAIGDYDAGIKYVDEIRDYLHGRYPEILRMNSSVESLEHSKKIGTIQDRKNRRGYEIIAEYLKVREAFAQDKAEGRKGSMKEGKPGRATLALIQSDYFPW